MDYNGILKLKKADVPKQINGSIVVCKMHKINNEEQCRIDDNYIVKPNITD